jgi:hypothetical protein
VHVVLYRDIHISFLLRIPRLPTFLNVLIPEGFAVTKTLPKKMKKMNNICRIQIMVSNWVGAGTDSVRLYGAIEQALKEMEALLKIVE